MSSRTPRGSIALGALVALLVVAGLPAEGRAVGGFINVLEPHPYRSPPGDRVGPIAFPSPTSTASPTPTPAPTSTATPAPSPAQEPTPTPAPTFPPGHVREPGYPKPLITPRPFSTVTPTPPANCAIPNIEGSKTFTVGKRDKVSVTVTGEAAIFFPTSDRRDSKVEGRVGACVLNQCRARLAQFVAEGHSSGGSEAKLVLAGSTVLTMPLQGSNDIYRAPFALKGEFNGDVELIPGILKARGEATVAGGAEVYLSYGIQALPPQADLSAGARAFAYGEGDVALELLGGVVGTAGMTMRVDPPNPNLTARLYTGVCLDPRLRADFTAKAWSLDVDAYWKVGCVDLPVIGKKCLHEDERSLLSRAGPERTHVLIDRALLP